MMPVSGRSTGYVTYAFTKHINIRLLRPFSNISGYNSIYKETDLFSVIIFSFVKKNPILHYLTWPSPPRQ